MKKFMRPLIAVLALVTLSALIAGSSFLFVSPMRVYGQGVSTCPTSFNIATGHAVTQQPGAALGTFNAPFCVGLASGMLAYQGQVIKDSPNIKHIRFGATTATAASAGATATTTFTWTTAFPDANYTCMCTGLTPTNVPAIVSVGSVTATNFVLTTVAITAAAASYAGVECIGIHDAS